MNPKDMLKLAEPYLKPVPTPAGFSSRDIVRRAIEFDDPPRVPYSFIQPLESDFVEVSAAPGSASGMLNIPKGELKFDEWGVGWRGSGQLWGHAEVTPLADLSVLDGYKFPQVMTPERLALVEEFAKAGNAVNKYVVGSDPIINYERLRSLMGFENMMVAMYADRERFECLLDKLTDMTIKFVQAYESIGGVHGFMGAEDWGLQTSLQIKPAMWREIFKPRYSRIVDACHQRGMHYLLHSCGYIMDIIPDFVEVGVDVLQIDQPRLLGVDRLAREFGGKVCFWNCVDIQWSSRPEVTPAEARAEAQYMVEKLACFGGGLMARQYLQPWDIEMPPEKHQAIYEGFMDAGCR